MDKNGKYLLTKGVEGTMASRRKTVARGEGVGGWVKR